MHCLGRKLVLWRAHNGTAHVMNSNCPHLGANLAQGCVIGDRIECAFHGWQFTGDGRVARVHYSDHMPNGFIAESFPVQELNGQLFMYHDSRRKASEVNKTPPYYLPSLSSTSDMDQGTFVYRGSYDGGRVKMNIYDFAENSVDLAHFQNLHGQMRLPWTKLRIPWVSLVHDADWNVDPDNSWRMYLIDRVSLNLLGKDIKKLQVNSVVSFYGPGSIVILRFALPGYGEIEICQTHLPIGPLELQTNFRWFANPTVPRWLIWYVVGNWVSQWHLDVLIWQNKVHLKNPRLSRGDGPIFKFREWYQQFLPDDPGYGLAP